MNKPCRRHMACAQAQSRSSLPAPAQMQPRDLPHPHPPQSHHDISLPTHDATRLRNVITAPCVRIVSLAGVETLMRLVNTSPEAFEISSSSL